MNRMGFHIAVTAVVFWVVVAALRLIPAQAAATCPAGTVAQQQLAAGRVCAIAPSKTDAKIADAFPGAPNTGFGDHVVALPASKPVGAIVFFVGSGQQPYGAYGYTGMQFISEALAHGFVVVMPAYANRVDMHRACGDDLACYGPARQRVFSGTGDTRAVATNVPNSVEFRLQKLAAYLHKTLPNYPWPESIGSTGIIWSQVYVGGLSYGGATAAFIAQSTPVRHACYLSSPLDGIVNGTTGTPALWVRRPFATSPNSMAGLLHTADPAFPKEIASFRAMRIPAANQILTSIPEASPHTSTLDDPRLAPERDRVCL